MVLIIEAISAFGVTSGAIEAVAEQEAGVMIVGTEGVMPTEITEIEEMIKGLHHRSVTIGVGIDGVAIHHIEAADGHHHHKEEHARPLMAHGIIEMHRQA
jgi:hypothetical protein